MKTAALHTLYLIPWDIGLRGDVTLRAARLVRRLSVLLAEDARQSAKQLRAALGRGAAGKRIVTIPPRHDDGFLARVLGFLAGQDVGLVSSSGMPCFVDPGGWLVREVRARGGTVVALPGPSALTTVLALSGFDWLVDPPSRRFSFAFFDEGGPHDSFLEALSRRDEPLVVFLQARAFPECLQIMASGVGQRPIAAFFDLTKTRPRFPLADEVRIRTCEQWRLSLAEIDWSRVMDVALLVHPELRRDDPSARRPHQASKR